MRRPTPKEEREERDRRWAEEQARIAALEAKFTALPWSEAKDVFRLAMLERAWWLLDAAQAEAADVLLEFLPRQDAMTLLEQFFETRNEFDPKLYARPTPPTDKRTLAYRRHVEGAGLS